MNIDEFLDTLEKEFELYIKEKYPDLNSKEVVLGDYFRTNFKNIAYSYNVNFEGKLSNSTNIFITDICSQIARSGVMSPRKAGDAFKEVIHRTVSDYKHIPNLLNPSVFALAPFVVVGTIANGLSPLVRIPAMKLFGMNNPDLICVSSVAGKITNGEDLESRHLISSSGREEKVMERNSSYSKVFCMICNKMNSEPSPRPSIASSISLNGQEQYQI